ncbi:Protein of unknown function [Cotesia congregata]|uniref:Mutator-like transposase domain-containing protein n=1 Tax=Cotesia congregata TaxID=51543 RepID=A0A8J2MJ02_COTCN|nr:Protein of unknown function [Cotesia congregata]
MQSYPKSKRNISTRSAKPRKRKFHGNQHCNNDEENTEPQSTSAKKLSTADEDDVHYSALRGYRLIEFFTVFTALSDILICRDCKLPVKFEESGNRGLGFKIVVICNAKPRKRKFHGNQHCNNDEENTEPQSTSAKKLSTADEDDVHYSALRGYRLIEFFTVFTALSDILICRDCKLPWYRGLGFKIVVICKCGLRNIFSGPLINNGYEVNRRIVFVMRLLGVAREGINLFCNMMDICNGLSESTYNAIVLLLHTTTQSLFKASCNANECYNSTVWRLCPKHLNSGLKIVEISAFIAAGLFNDGFNFILRVMNSMQIVIGRQLMSYREKIDDQRVSRENRRSSLTTKQARQACLQELTKKNESPYEK